jgi:RNA polymerase sigma-70 factor (ECF subfamily)
MLAEAEAVDKAAQRHRDPYNRRFCELFEAYQCALRRLAAAYVLNAADREDLVQDIATAVWTALPAFRGESSERTWIYRIAHNVAIRNASRVRTRLTREPTLEGRFDRPSGATSAVDRLISAEKHRALLDGIRELALIDRQIVMLHLEGLSAAEIQEITGVSAGAIATRLTRIRQRLAESIRAGGQPQ